jgi:3',5'-cyclic AMP phosphodiesterase CpdA
VLLSGDLADHATDEEYEQLRELVAPLGAPLYVLPGNHDDRRALHRNFGVPGGDGEPVRYSVVLGPLRLVVLDTTRPGEDSGALELVHARPRLFSPRTGWSYSERQLHRPRADRRGDDGRDPARRAETKDQTWVA